MDPTLMDFVAEYSSEVTQALPLGKPDVKYKIVQIDNKSKDICPSMKTLGMIGYSEQVSLED